MSTYLHSHQLHDRFQALDQFLTEHQSLWKPRPFTALRLDWETQYPALAAHLRQCTLADAETHIDPQGLPAPFPQLAARAGQLSALGELPDTGLPIAGHRLDVAVPGRKWQQIEAFSRRLGFREQTRHWLDWCSGKGHLGRRLLQPGQQLTCLEYNPELVAAGQALSDHHHLPATHVHQDVMAASSTQHLSHEKAWSPCTRAANCMCTCCARPASKAAATWPWPLAVTTAYRVSIISRYPQPRRTPRCS